MRNTTIIVGLSLLMTGCTTQSTRNAIHGYETSENHKQVAFDNVYRIANEQMLLNTTQYIKANADNHEEVVRAITAAWEARQQLEEARYQYTMGRSLNLVTVGQYLYDKQGWLNVLLEVQSKDFKTFNDAVEAGDATLPEGTSSPLEDLLKEIQIKE